MLRPLLFVLIGLNAPCFAATAVGDRAEVNAAVVQLANLYSDGLAVSYPQFRHVKFGKVFNERLDDAVVLFTLEGFHGGNAQAEYLAFFAAVEPEDWPGHKQHSFRLVAVRQVGGRSWRTFKFETMKLKPSAVEIAGAAWSESDAGCCPSLPIRLTFAVKDGAVTEVK